MFTNHHIAMQLAAERQRDLRAAKDGRRLLDRFASTGTGPPQDGGFSGPVAGQVGVPAAVAGRDPHLPEPRIRRNPAGQSADWTPVARERREARHGEARVGS
jgi:hypothetical protein